MIYCKNELEFVQHDGGCRVLVTPCQVHSYAMDSPDVVKTDSCLDAELPQDVLFEVATLSGI